MAVQSIATTAGGVEERDVNEWFRRERVQRIDDDKNEELDEETLKKKDPRVGNKFTEYSFASQWTAHDDWNPHSPANRKHHDEESKQIQPRKPRPQHARTSRTRTRRWWKERQEGKGKTNRDAPRN